MAKSTGDLWKDINSTDNIEKFLEKNKDNFINGSLGEYISYLLDEKKLTIARVARRGQMSASYLYKINENAKTEISRDRLLQICFGFGLTSQESQKLLRLGRAGELYPLVKRDSIIIFCLDKHIDIIECDKKLDEIGEKTLEKDK